MSRTHQNTTKSSRTKTPPSMYAKLGKFVLELIGSVRLARELLVNEIQVNIPQYTIRGSYGYWRFSDWFVDLFDWLIGWFHLLWFDLIWLTDRFIDLMCFVSPAHFTLKDRTTQNIYKLANTLQIQQPKWASWGLMKIIWCVMLVLCHLETSGRRWTLSLIEAMRFMC